MSDPTPAPPPEQPPAINPASIPVPLESDEPESPPPPAAAAPPASETPPPTPPAAPPPAEPPTMVPVNVLIEERNARKEAERALREFQADLLRRTAPQPQPDAKDAEELTALAQSAMLYKADGSGQFDLDAAKRVRDIVRSNATAAANAAVAPLRSQFVNVQAKTMRERIEGEAQKHGVSEMVRPILDQTLAADPNAFADPEVGAQLGAQIILSAVGAKFMQNGSKAPVATSIAPTETTPPIVTEAAGRRPVPAPELTPEMRRLARRRGWDPTSLSKRLDKVGGLSGHIQVEKDDK